jgi:ferredoxin-NADP reductase
MARTAVLGRLNWQLGTLAELVQETPRVASLVLDVPEWPGHLAGQHVDVRLTADDGYQAERSYSIASAPEDARLAITVERLDDGEVSPYLVGEVRKGDKVELRGPIGGYFVWRGDDHRPVLLVAGGSGVVPLMAIIRHRSAIKSTTPTRLLYSSRSEDDIIYRAELDALSATEDGLTVAHCLTRKQPAGWRGYARRIDRAMLEEVAWPKAHNPIIFVCGPTPLVEGVAGHLVDMGFDAASIKTERFGPTGG